MYMLISDFCFSQICVGNSFISGYVGDPSFLETLGETVKDLRIKNPNIKYICDPVMGDNGHFYVPEVMLTYHSTISR